MVVREGQTEDQKIRACLKASWNRNGRKLLKSGRKEPSPRMVVVIIRLKAIVPKPRQHPADKTEASWPPRSKRSAMSALGQKQTFAPQ